MLNLDRFLSCPSRVLGRRAGRTGLDCIPWVCGFDVDERPGDMVVNPVMGDVWARESSDKVVGADAGMVRPVSRLSPAVPHIEGGCAEVLAKKGWSTGLTVWSLGIEKNSRCLSGSGSIVDIHTARREKSMNRRVGSKC